MSSKRFEHRLTIWFHLCSWQIVTAKF